MQKCHYLATGGDTAEPQLSVTGIMTACTAVLRGLAICLGISSIGLLFLLSSCGEAADSRRFQQIDPNLKLVEIPLSLACAVPDAPSPGGPLTLTATIRNVSSTPAGFSYINPETDFAVQIHKDGRSVERTNMGRAVDATFEASRNLTIGGGSQVARSLKPDEQMTFEINLRDLYEIHLPGTYLAVVRRTVWVEDHRISIAASTTFTVRAAG